MPLRTPLVFLLRIFRSSEVHLLRSITLRSHGSRPRILALVQPVLIRTAARTNTWLPGSLIDRILAFAAIVPMTVLAAFIFPAPLGAFAFGEIDRIAMFIPHDKILIFDRF